MKKIYETKIRCGYHLYESEFFGDEDEGVCSNEGIVLIDDESNEFEGVLTLDYLKGNFDEKSIKFELFDFDPVDKEVEMVEFKSINYFDRNFPSIKRRFFFVEDNDEVNLKLECSILLCKQLNESDPSSIEEKLAEARKRFA